MTSVRVGLTIALFLISQIFLENPPLRLLASAWLVNKLLASENRKVVEVTKKIVTKMNLDNFKGCSFCNNIGEGDRRESIQIK